MSFNKVFGTHKIVCISFSKDKIFWIKIDIEVKNLRL